MRTNKVLIVSTDAELGEKVRSALEWGGVPSVLALDSAEAVRRIWQDRPTSVVVDLRCASIDPERIIRRARTCPEVQPASIIALCDDLDAADEWLERGCTLVLERGPQPQIIAGRIAAYILDRSREGGGKIATTA